MNSLSRQRIPTVNASLARRISLLTTVAAVCAAAPAWAQPSDEDVQENAVQTTIDDDAGEGTESIVVTGSRIQRRDLTSSSPLATIQDEEFKLSGAINVESVINTLPQVVPGSTGFDNNPGGGVATLDLRGLGDERTLILVNGRRWMFYDTEQLVDLNTIPQFLIDSIDVVTGGASAVYGSDALAGVVNFRLRTDLEGIELGGQYSLTERGDGRRYNAYVALGAAFDDGRGNVTAFAEHYKRGSIFGSARDFSSAALTDSDGTLVPGGSPTTPFGHITIAPTAVVGVAAPGQNAPTLARGAGNFASPLGGIFLTPGVSSARRDPEDLYNYGAANYLMVPQERFLAGAYASYEASEAVTVFVETAFVNNRVANELAATPVTGTFNINVEAACANLSASDCAALRQTDLNETAINAARAANGLTPLYGPAGTGGTGLDARQAGVVQVSLNRRILETGARNALDERNAYRVLAGVKGPVTSDLTYEAYYSFARTRNSQIQAGNISRSAFRSGFESGALNIFGAGTLSQEDLDSISIIAQNTDISQLQVASASISGSPWNLGFGADNIGFALGAEWRSMRSEFIPDTALGSGDVIGFNAGQPTEGGYNVKEVFGEVRIPILAEQSFAHRLDLNAAARYSDYSLKDVGGVWTYAVGAEFAPIRDLTFRGQYQRAIRAPNVDELFGGLSNGFPPATDPCSDRTPAASRTEALRALCIATGVPAGSVFTRAIQPADQIEAQFGGNPNLKEETADTYTFGAVFRPTFIPRLNITLDYYNIKVEDYIETFGGGLNGTLDLCYNVFQDASSAYCQAIVRNPSDGTIGGDFLPAILNANIATLETAGYDLQVDYSLPLDGISLMGGEGAKLNFFFLGTYTQKYDYTPVADNPEIIQECAGRFGIICVLGQPVPKYKWTSRFSLIDGPLTASLRWRHVSSVRDDDDATDYVVEKIGAADYFDLSFAFDVNKQFSLAFGVNNLFDKEPDPVGDNQEQSNTYPNVYDVLGRDFFVSASLRF